MMATIERELAAAINASSSSANRLGCGRF